MAASMIWKGVSKAHVLCVAQNEIAILLRTQKHVCRRRTMSTMAADIQVEKKTTIPEFIKPKSNVRNREFPIHSIYIMEDYRLKYSFEEAINMHKEAAQPVLTNTLHLPIYAELKLDLTTTKKTKFMRNIVGLLEFPHEFKHRQKKNIMVFTENLDDQELCKSLGATNVGGDDLIGLFNQGILRKDDVNRCDFMFASPAMAVKLVKIRSMLVDKFPSIKNGHITTDLEGIIKKYLAGVTYKSRKKTDAVGIAQVPFGVLTQDTKELEKNFAYMITNLSELKSKKQTPFIKAATLLAPPSEELFEIKIDQYVEGAAETTTESKTQEDYDSDDD